MTPGYLRVKTRTDATAGERGRLVSVSRYSSRRWPAAAARACAGSTTAAGLRRRARRGASARPRPAFGDDRVLLETYVTRPRHIEVQVFGDAHGNVVHLYRARLLLAAPPPEGDRRGAGARAWTPPPARRSPRRQCKRRARRSNYRRRRHHRVHRRRLGEGLRPDRIWFMEMNTRLQVEHPVTEMVTGLDLVEWQFRVAAGEPLPLKQAEIEPGRSTAGRSRRGSMPRARPPASCPPRGGPGALLRQSMLATPVRGRLRFVLTMPLSEAARSRPSTIR